MMAIRVEQLKKRYDRLSPPVLQGVDLAVARGEFFGLLGPNGSGKTTLVSILTAVLSADSGSVLINGEASGGRGLKQQLGLVPQHAALYPTLTLRENLEFFGAMHGLRGQALRSAMDESLQRVQLESVVDRQLAGFSGGMRQRANIAAGIIHRPAILFLDEPTVGVDPQSRQMIFDFLRDFNAAGVTMIYTTHYMEEAEQLCSRIGILDRGTIIAKGEPAALVQSYGCENLADLFLQLTGRALRD